MDTVPRSRLNAVEDELSALEEKLVTVQRDARAEIEALEKDAKTTFFRLMVEKKDSYSPETLEVMTRWRKKLGCYFND